MQLNPSIENYEILLVEDNPGDERLIREMLKEATHAHFNIQKAGSLSEGMAMTANDSLECVLLDLSLPDSQGLDTFLNFYQHARTLPIIVLTGLEDDEIALSAVQEGAQDYLSKNLIDSTIMERSIKYAVKRKQLEEELHLQATALQAAGNAIFITDREGAIEWVNPAFTQMSGYSPEEVLGQTPRILKSGEHARDFYEQMWGAILSGQVWRSDVTNRRKDGSLFQVEQTVTPFSGYNSRVTNFVAIQQDISQRKQAEVDKQNHIRELEALQNLTLFLRKADNLAETLPTFLDHVLSTLDLAVGEIVMYDSKLESLVQVAARGWFNALKGQLMSLNEGIGGRVYVSGELYVADEIHSSDRLLPWMRENIPPGWGGVCVPVQSNNTTVGTLFVSCQLPRKINAQEIRLLESLAEIAGSTIHRLKLLEETRADARRLAIINDIGRALSESLEINDIYSRLRDSIFKLIPDISTLIFSLFDQDHELILPAYVYHDDVEQDISAVPPIPLEPPGKGLQSHVIRTREALISNNFRADLDKKVITKKTFGSNDGKATQSALYIPMLAKERVVGVVSLQSYELDFFTREHADLLSVVANTAAVAIENARLFKQTQLRLERLKSLRAIDISITESPNLVDTLGVILDQVISQLGADAANILQLNHADQTLEYAEGKGFRTQALKHTRLPIGEGYAGQAALQKSLVTVHNLDSRKTDFLRSPTFSQEKFVDYFGIPLIAKNKVEGVLEVFLRRPFEPAPEWLDFLDALAGQAAIAIDNATLFTDLQDSNQNLLVAYDDTIVGWSLALDMRDKETEGHTRRVTELTLQLAREMGLSPESLVHIRRGALLHDIGKMGVPDAILNKPGKLDEQEWEIMRSHPVKAFEMLDNIDYLRPALEIPFAHHEKWDGSGYPLGLKGTDIPLPARIFAVVDVYDALTSDRPYRKAWSREQALEYIADQSGTHFDPDVAKKFLILIARYG